MNLKEAVNYYSLKKLESSQLPAIATQALIDGYDSESLRVLAGELNPSMADSFPLFEKSLKELNIIIPTEVEARLNFIDNYVKRILDYTLDPNEGAKQIYQIGSESDLVIKFVTIFEELSWAYESTDLLRPFNWLTKDQILDKIREEAIKLHSKIIETEIEKRQL